MHLTIDMLEKMESTLASAGGKEILLGPRANVPDIQPGDALQVHESQCEVSVGSEAPPPGPLPRATRCVPPRAKVEVGEARAVRTSSAQVTALYVSSPGSVTYTPECEQVLSSRRVLLWVGGRSDRDVPSPKRGYELPSLSGIRDVSEYVSGMLSLALPQSRTDQAEKAWRKGELSTQAGAEESLLQYSRKRNPGASKTSHSFLIRSIANRYAQRKRRSKATAHNSSEQALPIRPNFDISANRSILRERGRRADCQLSGED